MNKRDAGPIFVVGSPRSGTTLLSSILSSHPAIAMSPETHYLNVWVRDYRYLNLQNPLQFQAFWAAYSTSERFGYLGINAMEVRRRIDALNRYSFRGVFQTILEMFAEVSGKPRWGEKTPAHAAHADTLFSWFPECRMIYLLRDARAVVASLRKTPWGSATSIDRHAIRWAQGVARFQPFMNDSRVCVVRYERLVREPIEQVREVCSFVGEEFIPSMLSERTLSTQIVQSRSGWALNHLRSATDAVRSDSIAKWEAELSPYDISVIENYAGALMRRFLYPIGGSSLPLSERARLFLARSIGTTRRQPKRVLNQLRKRVFPRVVTGQ